MTLLTITPLSTGASLVAFTQPSLDAGNVKAFRAAIAGAIRASDTLLLDMRGLDCVDSCGLGALLSCLRGMDDKNGQLRLFGLSQPVLTLLELARMQRLFAIYDSQTQAQNDLTAA